MADPLEIVVLVGALVVVSGWLASHARVPPPLLQLTLGLLAGFVPAVRDIHLPSEAVLVLFLPALLFWEALTTSLREIRRDLRVIILMSTLLVVATAVGVAGVGIAFGLGGLAALVVGAALAPTDATAVGVLARSLPHRNTTLLRAESLVNDGTALVLYAIAVGLAIGQVAFDGWHVAGLIVLAYVGGGVIGLAAGLLGTVVLRRLRDPIVNNTALILVPFVAFLGAEAVGASGVIAVVLAGLVLSQTGPRISTARSREQTSGFWPLTTSILNGSLFVLIGIEAQSAVRAVAPGDIPVLMFVSLLAWVVILVIRFAFQVITAWLIRLVDRRPSQRSRRMSHRARVVSTVAGFRGAVSLALALAVPTAIGERAEIIFVTTGVVILTLVVQGMLLPVVIRWARFAPDTSTVDEIVAAQRAATLEAIRAAPEVAARVHASDLVRDRIILEYRERLQRMEAAQDAAEALVPTDGEYATLGLALLERKRDAVIRLRDQRVISDTTLRLLQRRLDRDSLRLSQSHHDD